MTRGKPRRSPFPENMDARRVRFEPGAEGSFTVHHAGRTAKNVRVRVGRPLSDPRAFLALLSEDGEDWGVVWNLTALAPSAAAALAQAFARHDLTARITRVRAIVYQFGTSEWTVDTDRGTTSFVIRSPSDHARWLSDDRVLLTDVDGSRYEIGSFAALDPRSRNLIAEIL